MDRLRASNKMGATGGLSASAPLPALAASSQWHPAGGGWLEPLRQRAAFTLLELVVALVILAAGLLAVQGLMVRQSRQVSHLEAWCRTDRTYYLVSQTDEMMEALGAPADLQDQAGQAAWAPPVLGRNVYTVTPVSVIRSPDGQQITAVVNLGS